MRNKENVCQYCTRQRAKSSLALMLIEIELAKYNAIVTYYKQEVQASSTSKQKQKLQLLTLPYIYKLSTHLYFHTLIRIFFTLFICFVFDRFLEWICFRLFSIFSSVWFCLTSDYF